MDCKPRQTQHLRIHQVGKVGFRIPVRFDELNKVALVRSKFGIPQATSKEFKRDRY
jgi:hypothetical protein